MADDGERLEYIKVLIRVRPLVALETARDDQNTSIIDTQPTEVILHGEEARHQLRCPFEVVLGPKASQTDVYGHVKDCVDHVAKGYNATVPDRAGTDASARVEEQPS